MITPLTVRPASLAELFERHAGMEHVRVYMVTVPKWKSKAAAAAFQTETGIDPLTVRKHAQYEGKLGGDYKEQQELVRDGLKACGIAVTAYKPGTSWHQPWRGSSVISANKKTPDDGAYFRIMPDKTVRPVVSYQTVSGTVIDSELVKKHLSPSAPSLVPFRCYKLESVRQVILHGGAVLDVEG